MKIPKVSSRLLMGIVLGVGLLMGLGLPAWEVLLFPAYHAHAFIAQDRAGVRAMVDENVPHSFWPRYRLRLLGRPWRRMHFCGGGRGRLEELCQFDAPDHLGYGCGFGSGKFLIFRLPESMDRKIVAMKGLDWPTEVEKRAKEAKESEAGLNALLDR